MNEEELFARLASSRNYRDVCEYTVKRAAREALMRYPKPKDAEKAAKEHLHGITSAFMTETQYKRALKAVEQKETMADALCQHTSTAERLPIEETDALYEKLFGYTGIPASILDLACGLNPVYLALRCPNMRICGIDISGACVRVLSGISHVTARCGDLLDPEALPDEPFDCALLFKVLPLLERQEKGAADRLLARVNARHIIASFPLKTLSGKNVGMREHYSEWMAEHIPPGRQVLAEIIHMDRELYYILE